MLRQIKVIEERLHNPWFEISWQQRSFTIAAIEPDGRARRARVKCGGFIQGMFSGRVQVTWEDLPARRSYVEFVRIGRGGEDILPEDS
jgi:hypothetical protein